jgi:hypothetical protein
VGGIRRKGKTSERRAHLSARTAFAALVSIMSIVFLQSCSDAIFNAMRERATTANRPTADPDTKKRSAGDSAAASVITAHETIVLTFPNAMDPAAVSVSGGLGPMTSDNVKWDPTGGKKVLKLNEAGAAVWTVGADKSVTVTVTDTGESVTYTFLYAVFSGACVSPPTDPTKPGASGTKGTVKAPLDTIQAGIDMAKSIYLDHSKGPAEVRVAKGTFQSNYHDTSKPVALMIEGVSLKGGYSSTGWSTVDTVQNESILEDTSITTSGVEPNRAVEIPATVTAATALQGFTIKLAKGVDNAGIFCLGSPQISNNHIVGRASFADAGNSSQQYGIYCKGSSAQPSIHDNIIDAGWNKDVTATQSSGIFISSQSSPLIENNTIDGGDGGTTSAVWTDNCSTPPYPRVNNNTLDTGTGQKPIVVGYGLPTNYGVYSAYSHPSVGGNIFTCSAPATLTCAIYEEDIGSDPEKVVNNHFDFNWGLFYRDYYLSETTVDHSQLGSVSVITMQGTNTLSAWGNY